MVEQEDGPAHARVFTVAVVYNDTILGRGTGNSKKEAEQKRLKTHSARRLSKWAYSAFLKAKLAGVSNKQKDKYVWWAWRSPGTTLPTVSKR